MIVQALKWIGGADGFLELVDQRRLPAEFVKLQCRDIEQLYEAITTLAVRGAPAIGVSAAYGLVLAMQKLKPADGLEQGLKVLAESVEYLSSSRPTAVNLFWALERICQNAKDFATRQPKQQCKNCARLFWPRRMLFVRKMWICAGGLVKTEKGLSKKVQVF